MTDVCMPPVDDQVMDHRTGRRERLRRVRDGALEGLWER